MQHRSHRVRASLARPAGHSGARTPAPVACRRAQPQMPRPGSGRAGRAIPATRDGPASTFACRLLRRRCSPSNPRPAAPTGHRPRTPPPLRRRDETTVDGPTGRLAGGPCRRRRRRRLSTRKDPRPSRRSAGRCRPPLEGGKSRAPAAARPRRRASDRAAPPRVPGPHRAPDRCRARRARSRPADLPSRHAPGRAPRCAARTRTPRARPQPRGRRARRRRASRGGDAAGAPPPARAEPHAQPRDASSIRAPPPASTSWKISHRPASSVRRIRWSARTSSDAAHLVLARACELREVGRLVRDLRPRRRDEVVEEQRRDVPLLRRQGLDRALEVVGHHLAGAAEPVERRGPERR